jgi:outer membrane protein assembly factor BamB
VTAACVAAVGGVWVALRGGGPAPTKPGAAPTGPAASSSSTASASPAAPPAKPGAVRWTAPIVTGSHTEPFVVGDVVIVEATTATAVKVSTGDVLWQLPAGPLRHFASDSNGNVYAYVQSAANRPQLASLDPATGQVRPLVALSQPLLQMTVADGVVYMLTGPGPASAMSAVDITTGSTRWTTPGTFNIAGRISVDSDRVYVGSTTTVFAVNRTDGSVAWQSTAITGPNPSVHAVADNLVLVHGGQGMGALNPATGSAVWHLDAPDVPLLSLPSGIEGDTLYMGALGAAGVSGSVRSVRAGSGAVNWKVTPTTGRSRVIVHDQRVYAVGDHLLAALDAATGHMLWSYTVDNPTGGGPVASGGLVLVATTTGKLYGIETG